MDLLKIQNVIKLNTHSTRWSRGVKYHHYKLVDHVNFNIYEDAISFKGMVDSEFQNEIYTSSILIDTLNYKILEGSCNCEDSKSKSTATRLFICKHLVATVLTGLDLIRKEDVQNDFKPLVLEKKPPLKPTEILLDHFNTTKEKVNLEVSIELLEDKAKCEFKLGMDKMYILKNIRDFANARYNNNNVEYGKHFIYNPQKNYFSDSDEKLIDFIEEYGLGLSTIASTNMTRYMELNLSSFKRFLYLLKDKNFEFIYNDISYKPSIIEDKLPISLEFSKSSSDIILSTEDDLPTPLTPRGDIILDNNNLYLLSNDKASDYKKIHTILKDYSSVSFGNNFSNDVLSSLIPKLDMLTEEVVLDDEIKSNIVKDLKVEYYFDIEKSNVICNLKFIYTTEKDKFIIKDFEKEKEAKVSLLNHSFIEDYNNKFIFGGDDYKLFNFLEDEITQLESYGDIYYSDKFKSRKTYTSSSISATISEGFDSYLNFNFNISDINRSEYKNILNAFKNNKTFYKLKNGSFIDLREKDTVNFFELVDNLNLLDSSENKVHNSKVFYLKDTLDSKEYSFISGKETINNLYNKYKEINEINFKLPDDLNATLRDYQVKGFNWFNTLDHYEFGGILADEMGLGKTIQTITFLLSQKNKKSLIVTPTSLIYNWKNEFDTFAPTMKVLLVHGNKKERERSLLDKDKYDVILTTYGTLRNDLDLYSDTCFDYCIIDEAQNIKNPLALSTKAVKKVNSKVNFALTGTPIENNLIELWSIFDFVIPGYLYGSKKFHETFVSSNDNTYSLKKLIKPFILRRTKKEVMKELPDKIENKLLIDLSKEQKKVYSACVNDIKDKIVDLDMSKDKFTILSYLTRLRQICLDPSVILDNYKGKSSKIETCIELIKDSTEDNHKILLFSQFTSVLKNIGEELSSNNISYYYIDGQTKALDRLKLVDDFNSSSEVKVFLISLKAGGTGLNLTSADVVIHFDPWWNPAVENQASDRAHRYGQKNVVQVIKLIAKGTIEENIMKLQETKKELIDQFINDDLSNSSTLKNLSHKEIIDLFN